MKDRRSSRSLEDLGAGSEELCYKKGVCFKRLAWKRSREIDEREERKLRCDWPQFLMEVAISALALDEHNLIRSERDRTRNHY